MSKLRGSMFVPAAAAALLLMTASAAMAAPPAAATGPAGPSCGDSWTNAAGGTWSTGADWSTGAPPTASQHACITIALTAPVVLTGAGTAKSLTLGGSSGTAELEDDNQVLTLGSSSAITRTGEFIAADGGGSNAIDLGSGATLSNDGILASESGSTLSLSGDVTNAPDGWTGVTGSATLTIDTGTFTNLGEVSVQAYGTLQAPRGGGTGAVIDNAAGVIQNQGGIDLGSGATFDQGAGELIGAAAQIGAPSSGGSLDLTGTGAGSFKLGPDATLTGNVAAGQTVIVDAGGTEAPAATGSFTNDGTLLSGSGGLEFTFPAGGTLTNKGSIIVPSPSDLLTVAGNVVNDGTIAMNGSTFELDGAVTLTNDGTITVPPQSTLQTGSAGAIDNAGGTIASGGGVDVDAGGTFAEGAGTTTGNPVVVSGALQLTGSGTSSFELEPGSTLSGTITTHQTVVVSGNSVSPVTAAKSFTNHGTLFGRGWLALPKRGTLTNDGTLEDSDEGSGGASFYLAGNLTNSPAGVIGEAGEGLTLTRRGTTFDNAGKLYLLTEGINLEGAGTCGNGSGQSPCDMTFDNTGTIYTGTGGDIDWGGSGYASSVQGALGDTVSLGGTIVPVPGVEPNAWPPPAGESIQYGIASANYIGTTKEWNLSCGGSVTEGWSMACPNGATLYENSDTTLVPTQVSVTGSGTQGTYNWTSSYGQPVTLTATVTAQDGSTPTGSVVFYAAEENGSGSSSSEGATAADLVGTAPLTTVGGVATATLTYNPPPGNYALLAVYSGDSAHLAAVAGAGGGPGYFKSQTVDAQTTAVAVKSSASSPVFGKPVTFTATVTAGATGPAKPTGVVTFYDAGVPFGTAAVSTAKGVTTAKLATGDLPAGSDSITATYSGDYNYEAASTSSSLSQTVTAPSAPTEVTVTGKAKVKAGATYKATSTTDGTGAVLFSLASTPAPPNAMTINASTGAVSYQVPTTGTSSFAYAVVASNAAGQAESRKVTVHVS
jgi:Bacterial Ig-like domain (group 3)